MYCKLELADIYIWCEHRKVAALSHQSLGCHHRSIRGSPLMHSKLFVGGKIQVGRPESR